jgi:hypothetical protein
VGGYEVVAPSGLLEHFIEINYLLPHEFPADPQQATRAVSRPTSPALRTGSAAPHARGGGEERELVIFFKDTGGQCRCFVPQITMGGALYCRFAEAFVSALVRAKEYGLSGKAQCKSACCFDLFPREGAHKSVCYTSSPPEST